MSSCDECLQEQKKQVQMEKDKWKLEEEREQKHKDKEKTKKAAEQVKMCLLYCSYIMEMKLRLGTSKVIQIWNFISPNHNVQSLS